MTDYSELIERLKNHARWAVRRGGLDWKGLSEVCDDAASALRSLVAENAATKETLVKTEKWANRMLALRQDVVNQAEQAEARLAKYEKVVEALGDGIYCGDDEHGIYSCIICEKEQTNARVVRHEQDCALAALLSDTPSEDDAG